jgi:hypothetical protein
VNETNRVARLPYYLDPGVSMALHEGRAERLFLLHPYWVEGVRPARAQGVDYAALGVRRLGKARDNHDRLGFSRDHQPFALVVLDEVEAYATDLDTPLPQVRRLVERHELQHQIDGPDLTHAPAVLKALAGYEHAAIDQVNRELSAYMAELMTDGVSPKLALRHVMPFLASKPGSSLNFVIHLELAALAPNRHEAALSENSQAIFEELSALSDAQLRQRTREAYAALFHSQLPDVKF